MASFGGYLCRFDTSSKVCFDTPLEYESPNVGAIVGTNYYYAKNVGRDGGEGFYYVGEINGDAPFFYEDATFGVSEDLYTGAVLDVAAVEEHDGDTKVIDGEGGRGYLVGLGGDYELLVVRLGEETGEPEAYAVLESSVEWGDDLRALGPLLGGSLWSSALAARRDAESDATEQKCPGAFTLLPYGARAAMVSVALCTGAGLYAARGTDDEPAARSPSDGGDVDEAAAFSPSLGEPEVEMV
jgi:hypothetical protein